MDVPFNATQRLLWLPDPHNNWLKGCELALRSLGLESQGGDGARLIIDLLAEAYENAQIALKYFVNYGGCTYAHGLILRSGPY